MSESPNSLQTMRSRQSDRQLGREGRRDEELEEEKERERERPGSQLISSSWNSLFSSAEIF